MKATYELQAPPRASAPPGASMERSVGSGFLGMLAGHAVYMACQWGMLVVLARLGSPEMLAQFALALATSAPIVLFTNMGLRRVLATDARSSFVFSDYLGLRLATNVAAIALTAGVAWGVGFRGETLWVILAMGAAKAVEATIDILHGLFQQRDRMDLITRSLLLRGPLSLAAFAAGFAAGGRVIWGVAAMGGAWLAVLALFDWPTAGRMLGRGGAAPRTGAGRDSLRVWAALAGVALPLGFVALLASLRSSIPTFVIAGSLDEHALGVFTALAYFHAVSNRVVSQLGEAATAGLSRHYAAGTRESFARLLKWMLMVSSGISLAGLGIALAAGGFVLRFFYGAPYDGEHLLFVFVMAAAAVANVQAVFDYGMTSARRFKVQPFVYGAGSLLLVVLCAALASSHGLTGVVIALGLVSAAEALAAALVVRSALTRMGEAAAPGVAL